MEIGKNRIKTSHIVPPPPSPSSSVSIILLITFLCCPTVVVARATGTFSPTDNILIDCGANDAPKLPDGRMFKTDKDASQLLNSKDDVQVSASNVDLPSPLFLTAKVFPKEATYSFELKRPGFHWLRLYFYAIKDGKYDLQQSTFSVSANHYAILHNFKISNASIPVLKEYLLNLNDPIFVLKFSPMMNSFAFVNGIEVVSTSDSLIADEGTSLFPVNSFQGLTKHGYQVVYRLNMGGPLITPQNDTLGRTWIPDNDYLKDKAVAAKASTSTSAIKYPETLTPWIAPATVYSSLIEMAVAEASTIKPNFNVTWEMEVDKAFDYLLRLHFCDIVSKALNNLYFNVYINDKMAISGLDLSSITGGLDVPYYKDIVVNASTFTDGLTVQIGPLNQDTGTINAILNGLEVMKMSNSADSLDGEFGVDGTSNSSHKGTVAVIGFAMMFGAFVGLGAMVIRWKRRPQDWRKRNSFSSWLLPLHAGDSSFLSMSAASQKSNFNSSTLGLGRYFSFAELQEATQNFDSSAIIGVGGFGNVYLGTIDDGTQVAVKRGNPQSEQGITEFQTEIQMLSKLRHRHLVSLIGYCDENSEMILVYEYMSHGPFRDHLYGKDLPSLSWKQRLEICIGAARGLHYLHTGTAQGIIHRDVKTTNILLDDAFVAKVADFGLSKDTPMGQTHVSTAVKGSFGYLDPEYFRRQQLTEKSDVYSFGVVLLETLCARPAINPQLSREQVNLAEWAMQWKRKGLLEKIIDPHLVGAINPESMNKFSEAAEKCLAEYGVDRPSMGDVLWNLEHALQLQQSSSEGKSEEENKQSNTTTTPTPAAAPPFETNSPAPQQETNPSTGGDQNTEYSGSMLAQFQSLDGR
ncbi:Receptor-like protein kinase THESEUS 1 [Hibiscus syriacus]|uniref:Receptor-like protein kinase THESEUS 1 n=1 Tax=Hibiscus syriacus TaxID=106335 RepID=A0A6A3CAM3_HIBSY|nr:probable receptor-like protein kinase At2g21480 [Hibiscus syriacus]KAE8725617.1 Receptor-like protein kinase THESEUS 1 [Hibiscus syriacus]